MRVSTATLILAGNVLLFVGLIVGLRLWRRRHGPPTGKQIAAILAAYWTLFVLSDLHPLFITNSRATVLVAAITLSLIWGIGYPWYTSGFTRDSIPASEVNTGRWIPRAKKTGQWTAPDVHALPVNLAARQAAESP